MKVPQAQAIATLLAVCVTNAYGKRTIRRGLDEESMSMMEFAAPSSGGSGTTSGKSGKEPPATDSCGLSGDWGPAQFPAEICKLESKILPCLAPPEFCPPPEQLLVKTCDLNYAFTFAADGEDGTLEGTFSELVQDGFAFQVDTNDLLGYFHKDTCAFQFVGGPSFATTFKGYILDGEMHIQASRTGPLNDDIFPLAWKGKLFPKKYNQDCQGTFEGPPPVLDPQPTDEFCRSENPDTFNGGCPLSLDPFEFLTGNSGFSDIAFGETICGTTSTFLTSELNPFDPSGLFERDFDWYKFTLDKPGFISITITSNIPIGFNLYKFPEEGCDGFNPDDDRVLQESDFAPSTDVNISVELDAPGEYVLQLQTVTSPPVIGVECGQYSLSLFNGRIEGAIVRDVIEPDDGEMFLDRMVKTHSE